MAAASAAAFTSKANPEIRISSSDDHSFNIPDSPNQVSQNQSPETVSLLDRSQSQSSSASSDIRMTTTDDDEDDSESGSDDDGITIVGHGNEVGRISDEDRSNMSTLTLTPLGQLPDSDSKQSCLRLIKLFQDDLDRLFQLVTQEMPDEERRRTFINDVIRFKHLRSLNTAVTINTHFFILSSVVTQQ